MSSTSILSACLSVHISSSRWPFGFRSCVVSNKYSAVMNDELVKATSVNPCEWLKAFVPAVVCRKWGKTSEDVLRMANNLAEVATGLLPNTSNKIYGNRMRTVWTRCVFVLRRTCREAGYCVKVLWYRLHKEFGWKIICTGTHTSTGHSH